MKFVFAFSIKEIPKTKILDLLFQVTRPKHDNKVHYLYLIFSCAFG